MSEKSDPPSDPRDNSLFRGVVGFLALAAGILGFAALFWIEIPARNENALMFAMGIVFGWGSAVIASEYGATTTGRKVAESAIRRIERGDIASDAQLPFENDKPTEVEIVQPVDKPVPTTDVPSSAVSPAPPAPQRGAPGATPIMED